MLRTSRAPSLNSIPLCFLWQRHRKMERLLLWSSNVLSVLSSQSRNIDIEVHLSAHLCTSHNDVVHQMAKAFWAALVSTKVPYREQSY